MSTSATGVYSAGTAFLAVVPSFLGIESAMQSELRKMGAKLDAQMQASANKGLAGVGKNAASSGRKAADDFTGAFNKDVEKELSKAFSALPGEIDKNLETPWHKAMASLRKDIDDLRNEKVGITIDENTFVKSLQNMRDRMKQLEDTAPAGSDFFNASAARTALDSALGTVEEARRRGQDQAEAYAGAFDTKLNQALDKGAKAIRPLTVTADTTEADRQVTDLRERIVALSGKTIGVNISAAEAIAEVKAIQEALKALDRDDVDIRVRVEAREASGALTSLTKDVEGTDNELSNMEKTANLTLSRMTYLILAGASLGSVLVPAAAAAAGAIGFLGTSAAGAASGVGVLMLGLSGLGTAIQALDKYSQSQAKSTNSLDQANRSLAGSNDAVQQAESSLANTRRTVANQQADAEEKVRAAVAAVGQARHDASISARDADRSTADAQRDLTRAETDAKDARTALNDAIKQAKKDMQDLRVELDRNGVDQQKAVTAQMAAVNDLHALQVNPRASTVELRRAKDNVDEQTVLLEELKSKRQDLQDQQDKQNRLGADGDTKVIAARKKVADADQKVGDQRVKAQRAEQDSAEKSYQSRQKIAAAQAKVADAERDQARQRAQGNYQIATAENAVATAARSQQQAVEKMGIAGGTALQNLNAAMANLSPTQRNFARFIFGLKDDFLDLRAAAADPMLPGFQKAIEMLLPYLPGVATFVGKIAAELGLMAIQAAQALQGPVWKQFFSYINDTAVPVMQNWFDIANNVVTGLLNIYLALTPLDGQVGRGLVGLSEDFAAWSANLGKSKGFQDFLDYVRENGPKVVHFLGELGELAVRLLIALAPIGAVALKVLTLLAEGLNLIPLPVLTVLVGVIAALSLGIAGLGAVVRAQKFKTELGTIFGDTAQKAIQKYAIDTGKATAETGKFRTGLSTASGMAGAFRDKIYTLPDGVVKAFGDKSRAFVNKYAIETGFATTQSGKFEKALGSAAGVIQTAGTKLKDLNTRVGGVRGAFSSLTSFLGGPWGIAIAAVTIAATTLGNASNKYHQDIKDMSDALGDLGTTFAGLQKAGKLGTADAAKQIHDLVDNNPKLQQAAILLGQIGISFDTLGSAAAGNKNDIETMMKILDEQIDATSKKWQDDSNFLFTVFSKDARADSDKLDALRKLKAALKDQADQSGLLAQVNAILAGQDEHAAAITEIKTSHQKDNATVVAQLIGLYDTYDTKISHLNALIDAFSSGEADAATKTQALNDVIDDQTKSLQGANEAAESYNAKLLDLKESAKQNGASLDINSRAGLANRDALEAAATAARDLYVQDIASGAPMDKATQRHQDRINKLKAEAKQAGFSKDETDKLITTYGEIPKAVITSIATKNFTAVYKQLQQMQFMQFMLKQGKSASEALDAWNQEQQAMARAQAHGLSGGFTLPAKATGGPIAGPGTGTSDDVVIRASDGEHMLTAEEVQAAGGHQAVYAWRKAILGGLQLPAFATGGEIKKKPQATAWPYQVNVAGTHVPSEADIEAPLWESLGGASGPVGNLKGGQGFRWQEAVMRAQFPNVVFTSTTGGHHAKNSWHYKGRAIDMIPHTRQIMKWIHDTYGGSTLELIGPYNDLDLWHGKPHQYSAALQREHQNHIHWAYDQGGLLQPGAQQVVNATGKPEPVLTQPQWAAVEQQNDIMRQLVANANSVPRGGNTYQFEFKDTTLDAARLRSMQQREDAMNRVGRAR